MKLNEAALQIPEFIVSEDSESKFYAQYFMRMIQEIENSDAENLKRKKSLVEESRKAIRKMK